MFKHPFKHTYRKKQTLIQKCNCWSSSRA